LQVGVRRNARVQQMMRTGLSGAAATVVDVIALIALVEAVGMGVGWAALMAAGTGAMFGFVMAKFWAFGDRAPLTLRQVAAYAVVAGGAAVLVAISIHLLVVFGAAYLMAKLIASIGVFALWSYPAQARWVFAKGNYYAY
jgi:putative flippase GtrA